jgi:hypothetical protein
MSNLYIKNNVMNVPNTSKILSMHACKIKSYLNKYYNTSNFFSSEQTISRSSPVPVPVIADIGTGVNLAGIMERWVKQQIQPT